MSRKQIISRSDAKLQGLTTYYTGKRCRNGHLASRYTSSGGCTECQRQSSDNSRALQKVFGKRTIPATVLLRLLRLAA